MRRSTVVNQRGFSIIEFIVTMALLLIVFAAAFQIFIPVARRSKVEGGNVQTQIEGVIGLELLRKDVVHAGAGLPWVLNGANYSEATEAGRDTYNDAASSGTDNPPRPIIAQDAVTTSGLGLHSSDYLVLKSMLVANPVTTDGTTYVDNPASSKWSYVNPDGSVRTWNSADDDMVTTDRVVVVQPASGTSSMVLTVDTAGGGAFFTNYATSMPAAFRPTGNSASYMFGVDSLTDPRMPFNRADYYISTADVPSKCAPGTGVLVKTILRQDNGQMGKELPLLDCVVTFQVALGVDNSFGDGLSQKNCLTNNLSSVTINGLPGGLTPAETVRSTVKEVRIYILAQEGTFDMDYNFINFTSGSSILVGEPAPDCDAPGGSSTQSCNCSGSDGTLGSSFDMSTLPSAHGGTWTFNKFRWRVYKMVIKPESIVTIS